MKLGLKNSFSYLHLNHEKSHRSRIILIWILDFLCSMRGDRLFQLPKGVENGWRLRSFVQQLQASVPLRRGIHLRHELQALGEN